MLSEPVVSTRDRERLVDRVARARSSWVTYAPYLDAFGAELRTARAVPPADVPRDVITMNSRFALKDLRTGGAIAYALVYPEAEAPRDGKLSVLSPMGMALLGARTGDVVRWSDESGPATAEVLRLLYQPEAAGDHDL
jgi:regulator of nucleoside diphosphate kinase